MTLPKPVIHFDEAWHVRVWVAGEEASVRERVASAVFYGAQMHVSLWSGGARGPLADMPLIAMPVSDPCVLTLPHESRAHEKFETRLRLAQPPPAGVATKLRVRLALRGPRRAVASV